MRKFRIFSLLMAFALLTALLSGCERDYTTVRVAYVNGRNMDNPDSEGIVYESRRVAKVEKDRLYRLALQLAAEEPEDKGLYTVLPENMVINSITPGRNFTVDVDESFDSLSGIERTLALYCIAKTVLAFGEAESVSISVDGIVEAASLREEDIVNNRDKLRFVDYDLKLYFPDEDGEKCRCIDANIHVSKASDPVIEAVRLLLKGQDDIKLTKANSKTPVLLSLKVSKRICYINFNENFVGGCVYDSKGVNLTVYSIVNTLTQFSFIDRVKIVIAGTDAGSRLGEGMNDAVYPNLALTM